jgi:hypothetical protein
MTTLGGDARGRSGTEVPLPVRSPTVAARFPDERPPRSIALTLASGPHRGRRFLFEAPCEIVLGRGRECDVALKDELVSRNHCVITFDESGARLRDLGSANGTIVDGNPAGDAALVSGSRIVLGDTTLECRFSTRTGTQPLSGHGLNPTLRGDGTEPPPVSRESVAVPGYTILDAIGEGSFGTVWKARSSSGRIVAIKVQRTQAELATEERVRFFREGELAAVLDHPNVIRVVARGELKRTLYIVMEFVAGRTLGEVIDRSGPLSVRAGLRIARQIASALEAARRRKIVHRDVKPDNILLRDDGVAKLGDFGFAKSSNGVLPHLTQYGQVVGTIAYMAPEQLECSLEADHRADIYSLGATLFHVLAGTPPFGGGRPTPELFSKVLHEPAPSIASLRPGGVPAGVERLVGRCLEKTPEARFQKAGEIVRRIDALLARRRTRRLLRGQ